MPLSTKYSARGKERLSSYKLAIIQESRTRSNLIIVFRFHHLLWYMDACSFTSGSNWSPMEYCTRQDVKFIKSYILTYLSNIFPSSPEQKDLSTKQHYGNYPHVKVNCYGVSSLNISFSGNYSPGRATFVATLRSWKIQVVWWGLHFRVLTDETDNVARNMPFWLLSTTHNLHLQYWGKASLQSLPVSHKW
jgi:hypothetical protein